MILTRTSNIDMSSAEYILLGVAPHQEGSPTMEVN